MPSINAGAPLESVVGVDCTVHTLSVHRTLVRRQSILTASENLQPAYKQSRLLVAPSEAIGAAYARATKGVSKNVSPDMRDVTHWKRERRGRRRERSKR